MSKVQILVGVYLGSQKSINLKPALSLSLMSFFSPLPFLLILDHFSTSKFPSSTGVKERGREEVVRA
jgi:hypothetical protein